MTTIDRTRSPLRTVALPSEHGGWGLTSEPILLGLLLAPSGPGVLLGLAAMLAFLARTPLKFVLVDAARHRTLERTVVARRLLAVELLVLVALVGGAFLTSSRAFWVPALVAAPLVLVELWFDMRSRGRRLAPELAGSIGIASVAAMIAVAGGARPTIAIGAWIVLSARALTSIPFVRRQIALLHGRVTSNGPTVAWDALAVFLAVVATVIARSLVVGSLAVVAVVVGQRLTARRPAARAAIVGIRQMVFGFVVVLATWLGVVLTGGAT